MNGTELASGLRAMADAIDGKEVDVSNVGLAPLIYCYDSEQMVAIAREIGGQWDKRVSDTNFFLDQKFGELTFSIFASRERVCEKVQVGEELVPKYEWRCPDSLLQEVAQ